MYTLYEVSGEKYYDDDAATDVFFCGGLSDTPKTKGRTVTLEGRAESTTRSVGRGMRTALLSDEVSIRGLWLQWSPTADRLFLLCRRAIMLPGAGNVLLDTFLPRTGKTRVSMEAVATNLKSCLSVVSDGLPRRNRTGGCMYACSAIGTVRSALAPATDPADS